MRARDWQLKPEQYPFRCTLTPLFAEVGIERHINNVHMQGLYLEARVRHRMQWLDSQSWCSRDGLLLRPRATATHFIRETRYPADITVAVRPLAVTADRYRLALAMFQDGDCMGVQDCVMGAWRDGAWVALPDGVRERLAAVLMPASPLPEEMPALGGDDFDRWPAHPPLTPRYADRDADRYLSEKSVARYLEQSRMATLNLSGGPEQVLMVARTDIRFHHWHPGLPEAVSLPGGVARIGNTSAVVRGAVRVDGEPLAVSDSVLVAFDGETRRPAPITGAFRESLERLRV